MFSGRAPNGPGRTWWEETTHTTDLELLIRDERGASMVEYGYLASLIAIVALVAVQALERM